VTHPSHSHDVTHPSHDHDVTHPTHDHAISGTTDLVSSQQITSYYENENRTVVAVADQTKIDEVTLGSSETGWPYWFKAFVGQNTTNSNTVERMSIKVVAGSGVQYFVIDTGGNEMRAVVPASGTILTSSDLEGETLELFATVWETSDGNGVTLESNWSVTAIPEHDHAINDASETALGTNETSTAALGTTTTESSANKIGFTPGVSVWDGIDQSPELTPSNVDLLVNGSTVASNIGSGEFETTVDLTDELIRNNWNDVEVTSDERGFVSLTVYAEAYRKVGGGQ